MGRFQILKRSQERKFFSSLKRKGYDMFIEMALAGVKARRILPEDRYDLIIPSASKEEKEGKTPRISVLIGFPEHPEAENMFHSIWLAKPEDTPEKVENKLRMAVAFFELFEIPTAENGVELTDFPGSVASNVPVYQDEYEGKIKNILQIFG